MFFNTSEIARAFWIVDVSLSRSFFSLNFSATVQIPSATATRSLLNCPTSIFFPKERPVTSFIIDNNDPTSTVFLDAELIVSMKVAILSAILGKLSAIPSPMPPIIPPIPRPNALPIAYSTSPALLIASTSAI